MTREEFIPGVLFRFSGSKMVHTLRRVSDTCILIEHCGVLQNNGTIFPLMPPESSYHIEFTKIGFRMWTETGGIYLNSRVIPFSSLTKVEIPQFVTNPTTI